MAGRSWTVVNYDTQVLRSVVLLLYRQGVKNITTTTVFIRRSHAQLALAALQREEYQQDQATRAASFLLSRRLRSFLAKGPRTINCRPR